MRFAENIFCGSTAAEVAKRKHAQILRRQMPWIKLALTIKRKNACVTAVTL